MLNISDLLLLLALIRFLSFNLILLTQIDNLEVKNHEISSIFLLMINKIKISAVIKIMTEIMTETEIKTEKTETEIMIMIMKAEVKVKIVNKIIIINKDLELTAMSV